MTKKEVEEILAMELKAIPDKNLRKKLEQRVISPQEQKRIWEWRSASHIRDEYSIWLLLDIGERDVAIALADGGFASEGYPWGLVFRSESVSGPPGNWYSSLGECAQDSGYFE